MGRGKRKYEAALQPNGAPTYQSNNKSWTVPNAMVDSIDATSFGSSNRTYLAGVSWFATDAKASEPGAGTVLATGDMAYEVSGTFQGDYFSTGEIDILKDNPVEAVVREVLGLAGDDELLGISYRTKSGEVVVRPWSGE